MKEISSPDSGWIELVDWLQEFPPHVQVLCREWHDEEVRIIQPDPDLAEFRMQSENCLKKVQATIQFLHDNESGAGRVIWLLENRDNRGLDDFEAEAVFGQWLAIDMISQQGRGTANSRMIVCGRLRENIAGLSFYLDVAFNKEGVLDSLDILATARIPFTLFVGHDAAVRLMAKPDSSILERLKNLMERELMSPALWIPLGRIETALENMSDEIEPLRTMTGDRCQISMVRFANSTHLNPPQRLKRAMDEACLSWDSSLVAARDIPLLHETVRNGPYLRGGAYVSQMFDIRTPAGFSHPAGIKEIIAFPLAVGMSGSVPLECQEYVAEQWQKWWNWRCRLDIGKLSILLDYKRMETYFQQLEGSLELNQSYHEYRVYNWPAPAPALRTTFIEAGTLDNAAGVQGVVNHLSQVATGEGYSCRMVGQSELLVGGEKEISQRNLLRQKLLDNQVAAHDYLQTISIAEPLRQDIVDFARFIPDTLGNTLELGSGYGRLAMELAPRSTGYTCVDLRHGMLRGFAEGKGRFGVVADAHQLPFDTEVFDAVIANNILEHLYEPLKALQEVLRVLRQNGRLYALIPLDALNSAYELRTHLWKADMENIRYAFDMAGFALQRLEAIDLYELGIKGAFPTCNGLVCKVEAAKLVKDREC